MWTRRAALVIPLLLLAPALLAQTADTTAARKQGAHRQETFRDENGNGVNDRLERRILAAERKKDRFIDADGDGICDGRAGGLGFRRGSASSTTGTGGPQAGKEAGKGNRSGQGGKK